MFDLVLSKLVYLVLFFTMHGMELIEILESTWFFHHANNLFLILGANYIINACIPSMQPAPLIFIYHVMCFCLGSLIKSNLFKLYSYFCSLIDISQMFVNKVVYSQTIKIIFKMFIKIIVTKINRRHKKIQTFHTCICFI